MYDGHYLEDLTPGMTATVSRTVSEADVVSFAEVTGDRNPLHLDETYAAGTRFGGRIIHGMLSAGFISCVLGTQLPGPGGVYLNQSLAFRAPVRIGDTVATTVTVTEIDPDRRLVRFATVCRVGDKAVVEGDALLLVPSRAG